MPGKNNPPSQDTIILRKELPGRLLFLLHAACFLLVVLYVNMYQFWAWLVKRLGAGVMASILPVTVTVAVLLVISLSYFVHRVNRGYGINLVVLGLGMVGAFLALAIPDPNVPIKRIHVAEYITLSFLVRYTLSHRLQGAALTLFTDHWSPCCSAFMTRCCRDLHSLRYYGWRDILVNGMAGLSGALLGHGLRCFVRPLPVNRVLRNGGGFSFRLSLLYLALAAATAWLVVSLFAQRGGQFSILSFLPLAVASLLVVILYPECIFTSGRHHGLQVLWWLACALLLYPLLTNYAGMEFI